MVIEYGKRVLQTKNGRWNGIIPLWIPFCIWIEPVALFFPNRSEMNCNCLPETRWRWRSGRTTSFFGPLGREVECLRRKESGYSTLDSHSLNKQFGRQFVKSALNASAKSSEIIGEVLF